MAIAKVPLELLVKVGPLGPRGSKGRLPATLEVELMNQLARVGVKNGSTDISISTGRPTRPSAVDPIIYAAVEFAYERARKDLGADILKGIYGLNRTQSERLVTFLERMIGVKDEMLPKEDQRFADVLRGDADYEQTNEGIHKYSTSTGTAEIVVSVSRQPDGLFQVSSSAKLVCAQGAHYERRTIIDLGRTRLRDYLENEIVSASDASHHACKTFCNIPAALRNCSY